MRVAFDTSVLVPAVTAAHANHRWAIRWVQAIEDGAIEGRCCWHAVAETWSVLTWLPREMGTPPALAELVVKRLSGRIKPVALRASDYREALARCAARGYRSGAVFDALHLVSAERDKADLLLTFNEADFARLATAESPRIVAPTVAPPTERIA